MALKFPEFTITFSNSREAIAEPTHDAVQMRINETLSMSEADSAVRLMALVALTKVSGDHEIPPALVDSIKDVATEVIDKIDDDDYRVGEVIALVDAAQITGDSEIAEAALEVVETDTDYERFSFDTHAAVNISIERGLGYTAAVTLAQTMRHRVDIPITVTQDRKIKAAPTAEVATPLGSEYNWLFEDSAK